MNPISVALKEENSSSYQVKGIGRKFGTCHEVFDLPASLDQQVLRERTIQFETCADVLVRSVVEQRRIGYALRKVLTLLQLKLWLGDEEMELASECHQQHRKIEGVCERSVRRIACALQTLILQPETSMLKHRSFAMVVFASLLTHCRRQRLLAPLCVQWMGKPCGFRLGDSNKPVSPLASNQTCCGLITDQSDDGAVSLALWRKLVTMAIAVSLEKFRAPPPTMLVEKVSHLSLEMLLKMARSVCRLIPIDYVAELYNRIQGYLCPHDDICGVALDIFWRFMPTAAPIAAASSPARLTTQQRMTFLAQVIAWWRIYPHATSWTLTCGSILIVMLKRWKDLSLFEASHPKMEGGKGEAHIEKEKDSLLLEKSGKLGVLGEEIFSLCLPLFALIGGGGKIPIPQSASVVPSVVEDRRISVGQVVGTLVSLMVCKPQKFSDELKLIQTKTRDSFEYKLQNQGVSNFQHLFSLLHPYYHPHQGGHYSSHLGQFLRTVSQKIVKYVSPQDVKPFLPRLLPICKFALFSKSKSLSSAGEDALFFLSTAQPEEVLPEIYKISYHALHSMVAVHQACAVLSLLARCAMLICENLHIGGSALSEILEATLAGLDSNDPEKSKNTLKFLGSLLSSLPLPSSEDKTQVSAQQMDVDVLRGEFLDEFLWALFSRVLSVVHFMEDVPISTNFEDHDDYCDTLPTAHPTGAGLLTGSIGYVFCTHLAGAMERRGIWRLAAQRLVEFALEHPCVGELMDMSALVGGFARANPTSAVKAIMMPLCSTLVWCAPSLLENQWKSSPPAAATAEENPAPLSSPAMEKFQHALAGADSRCVMAHQLVCLLVNSETDSKKKKDGICCKVRTQYAEKDLPLYIALLMAVVRECGCYCDSSALVQLIATGVCLLMHDTGMLAAGGVGIVHTLLRSLCDKMPVVYAPQLSRAIHPVRWREAGGSMADHLLAWQLIRSLIGVLVLPTLANVINIRERDCSWLCAPMSRLCHALLYLQSGLCDLHGWGLPRCKSWKKDGLVPYFTGLVGLSPWKEEMARDWADLSSLVRGQLHHLAWLLLLGNSKKEEGGKEEGEMDLRCAKLVVRCIQRSLCYVRRPYHEFTGRFGADLISEFALRNLKAEEKEKWVASRRVPHGVRVLLTLVYTQRLYASQQVDLLPTSCACVLSSPSKVTTKDDVLHLHERECENPKALILVLLQLALTSTFEGIRLSALQALVQSLQGLHHMKGLCVEQAIHCIASQVAKKHEIQAACALLAHPLFHSRIQNSLSLRYRFCKAFLNSHIHTHALSQLQLEMIFASSVLGMKSALPIYIDPLKGVHYTEQDILDFQKKSEKNQRLYEKIMQCGLEDHEMNETPVLSSISQKDKEEWNAKAKKKLGRNLEQGASHWRYQTMRTLLLVSSLHDHVSVSGVTIRALLRRLLSDVLAVRQVAAVGLIFILNRCEKGMRAATKESDVQPLFFGWRGVYLLTQPSSESKRSTRHEEPVSLERVQTLLKEELFAHPQRIHRFLECLADDNRLNAMDLQQENKTQGSGLLGLLSGMAKNLSQGRLNSMMGGAMGNVGTSSQLASLLSAMSGGRGTSSGRRQRSGLGSGKGQPIASLLRNPGAFLFHMLYLPDKSVSLCMKTFINYGEHPVQGLHSLLLRGMIRCGGLNVWHAVERELHILAGHQRLGHQGVGVALMQACLTTVSSWALTSQQKPIVEKDILPVLRRVLTEQSGSIRASSLPLWQRLLGTSMQHRTPTHPLVAQVLNLLAELLLMPHVTGVLWARRLRFAAMALGTLSWRAEEVRTLLTPIILKAYRHPLASVRTAGSMCGVALVLGAERYPESLSLLKEKSAAQEQPEESSKKIRGYTSSGIQFLTGLLDLLLEAETRWESQVSQEKAVNQEMLLASGIVRSVRDDAAEGEKAVTTKGAMSSNERQCYLVEKMALQNIRRAVLETLHSLLRTNGEGFQAFLVSWMKPILQCSVDHELSQLVKSVVSLCGQIDLGSGSLLRRTLEETVKLTQGSPHWKVRVQAFYLLQLQCYVHTFYLVQEHQKSLVARILHAVVEEGLQDGMLEVREAAATCFGSLVRTIISPSQFTEQVSGFIQKFEVLMESGRRKKNAPRAPKNPKRRARNQELRHAGALGMAALLSLHPYSVATWMPQVVDRLAMHAHDPARFVQGTVSSSLREFRRTHHDQWEEHALHFTKDQLTSIQDLLISPSYYA